MKKISLLISFVAVLFISGCNQAIRTAPNMGIASHLNATQMNLFGKMAKIKKKTLVFTSLVNVDNFKQSSNFGRLYTDLMMNQLRQEGWNIIDFRGQNIVSQNSLGEFYLNRSKSKLIPKDASVFVGTYGRYRGGLLLNLRILRLIDNVVLTSSSVLLKDSEALSMAQKDNCKNLSCRSKKPNNAFTIKMLQDDCLHAKNCAKAQQ